MATMITSECINCGACEPECPNTAIYQGGVEWQAPDGAMHPALSNDIFYIVPEKCTECVGFHDQEACAAVCPVDCCVPNPDIPETHEVLLDRARVLHPELTIGDDAPSRFRKDSAGAPAEGNGKDAAAAPAAVPAAPAAPKAPPAAVAAKPAAAPTRGRVEKALAPPPKARPAPSFAGELAVEYDQLVADLGTPRRHLRSRVSLVPLALLAAGQGFLGALSPAMKQRIDASVSDRRFFDPQLATAANIFLNLVIYPVACVVAAIALRHVSLFTPVPHHWIVLGLAIGVGEAAWRLRESFFGAAPLSDVPLRGALYGPLLWPLGRFVIAALGARGAASSVGFDGFYAGRDHYDEKLERERRYGSVYRLEERDDAYILHVEFPRVLPPSSLADDLGLSREMPDYDYELALRDGTFEVHGRVTDPRVRKLTAVAPAFPSEFTTRVALRQPVQGFRHRYRDKMLEVILPKATAA